MLVHFSSVLRADNSEKFCANHTSLGISWLHQMISSNVGASPSWGSFCLLWHFLAHSGSNESPSFVEGSDVL